jgi:single-strand DNA-binding protein
MMRGVNRVEIIGNLGRAPEVRYTGGGKAVANFTVATNEEWKDDKGQKQERAEWHRVVVWGLSAEACGQYLDKGSRVRVEGQLRTREWTDKENVKRYTTEVHARDVLFLDRAEEDSGRRPPPVDDNDAPERMRAAPPAAQPSFDAPFEEPSFP